MFLNISQLVDSMASIPSLYDRNISLCEIMAFVHYYSGLSTVIVCGMITLFLYYMVTSGRCQYRTWHLFMAFGIPLITILPFFTNSYGSVEYIEGLSWCTAKSNREGDMWSILVLYGPVWIVLIFSIGFFVVLIFKVSSKYSELLLDAFHAVGVYPTLTAILWIPRTIRRLSHFTAGNTLRFEYFGNLQVFMCGLLYSLVFLIRYKSFVEYEENYICVYDQEDYHIDFIGPDDCSSITSMDDALIYPKSETI